MEEYNAQSLGFKRCKCDNGVRHFDAWIFVLIFDSIRLSIHGDE